VKTSREPSAFSRRTFIASGAALATGWGAATRASTALGRPTARPPGFPPGVGIEREAFENWSQTIAIDSVWTCAPGTAEEVVASVNWAWEHGYRVRARGRMHNWSPLALAPGSGVAPRVLLVDTTRHLTHMRMARGHPGAVTAQTGVSMEALLGFLESAGHGLVAHPAPGDLTLGGVLAIDGHGTAIPARGERVEAGESFGSVSNLVLSLTAVVWSERRRRYVLREFVRDDPICASLLTHLGRAFVTEVTLRAGPLSRLRCVSRVDIPARELFAAPPAGGRTLASFLDAHGRAEAIMYPFTENPWLKVWSVSPRRPAGSRRVTAPYNYPFSDTLPDAVQQTLRRQLVSDPGQAVGFGALSYQQTVDGLRTDDAYDIWGAAKDLLLYVRPSTLRATANGYAILTRRDDVQRVVSEFFSFYRRLLERYRARGLYPLNLPIEVRVTGLDRPGDVGVAGAQPALLSALSPRPDHRRWDVAVWLDILTFPGTPASNRAYRDTERWMLANYRPPYATVRPEWSKGWAYTTHAPWTDRRLIGVTIPDAFRAGRPRSQTWDAAVRALDRLDPHGVFTSPLLRSLLKARAPRYTG
jgi:FAD/FMN-containing dehydrogenase